MWCLLFSAATMVTRTRLIVTFYYITCVYRLQLSVGVTLQFCKGNALSDCCSGNILYLYLGCTHFESRPRCCWLTKFRLCVVFLSLSRWLSWCRPRLYPTYLLLMFCDYCTRMFESDLSSNLKIILDLVWGLRKFCKLCVASETKISNWEFSVTCVGAGSITAVVMLRLKWRRRGNGPVISVNRRDSGC
jgi:hypothetical protein